MSFITTKKSKISSTFQAETNTFMVSLSDAEAQVIRHKAQKAGMSISEYLRNAALGFPIG